MSLDHTEKTKRKQNLLLLHSLNGGPMGGNRGDSNGSNNHGNGTGTVNYGSSPSMSAMSPHAPSFYPPLDTVESVIGKKGMP